MGIKILETTANSISAEYYESISDGSSSDAAYLQWVLNADGESTRSQRTSDKANNYAVTFTGLTANKSYYLTGTLYDAMVGRSKEMELLLPHCRGIKQSRFMPMMGPANP